MEKEFVPYEQALELKELGFNEPCLASWNFYNNELNYNSQPSIFSSKDVIQLPTFSQAFRRFRDTHNVLANVYSNASGFLFEYHDTIGGTHRYDSNTTGPNDAGCWDTYEEAELECLKKLIEILKSKQITNNF